MYARYVDAKDAYFGSIEGSRMTLATRFNCDVRPWCAIALLVSGNFSH